MNNTAVILPYTLHSFSSMKLCLWSKLWRFILVNPLPFVWWVVIKDPFFIFLRNGSFLCIERRLVTVDMQSSFPIFFKWWQIVDWDLLRSSANSLYSTVPADWAKNGSYSVQNDCIPLILLNHLDWGLMSVLVWVNLLMAYRQNETCKPILNLAVNNDTVATNNFTTNILGCFYSVFVIFKLAQHYVSNMYFQFLHFRGMRL